MQEYITEVNYWCRSTKSPVSAHKQYTHAHTHIRARAHTHTHIIYTYVHTYVYTCGLQCFGLSVTLGKRDLY
jgi:hypothetical protein